MFPTLTWYQTEDSDLQYAILQSCWITIPQSRWLAIPSPEPCCSLGLVRVILPLWLFLSSYHTAVKSRIQSFDLCWHIVLISSRNCWCLPCNWAHPAALFYASFLEVIGWYSRSPDSSASAAQYALAPANSMKKSSVLQLLPCLEANSSSSISLNNPAAVR